MSAALGAGRGGADWPAIKSGLLACHLPPPLLSAGTAILPLLPAAGAATKWIISTRNIDFWVCLSQQIRDFIGRDQYRDCNDDDKARCGGHLGAGLALVVPP